MELLEALIQNEHIVEYACVTVFTLVGLASYTYLVYRNSIKEDKPDSEVESIVDDLESNIGSIHEDTTEVIDKGKGKMVDRGVDVLSQKLTDDVNQTDIPLKVNLFKGSDYKEKLRLIYGDEIVKFSENSLGSGTFGVVNGKNSSPRGKPEATNVDQIVGSITGTNSTGFVATGDSSVDINVSDVIPDIIF